MAYMCMYTGLEALKREQSLYKVTAAYVLLLIHWHC